MPLFGRRARDAKKAASIAAGKAPRLKNSFPPQARFKIGRAMAANAPVTGDGGLYSPPGTITAETFKRVLNGVLMDEWGEPVTRGIDYVLDASDVEVLDMIEAWFVASTQCAQIHRAAATYGDELSRSTTERYTAFRQTVNDVMNEYDIAWTVSGEIVLPTDSSAMHATIVEPVLALTSSGDPRWAAVEAAYQKALLELKPGGDPSDAITDAGTALQHALEAAGAQGNALGTLLTDARKRGLLAPYDSKLSQAIDLLGEWVSADRSGRGDAHHTSTATVEDAWLAVQVAGALILRLAAGKKR